MWLLLQWSKVKRAGMAPQPRSSFGMVTHKNRAILFGGVTDQAGKGDRLFSENHDELYQFNLESRRWFPVSMRAPAKAKAAAQVGSRVLRISLRVLGQTGIDMRLPRSRPQKPCKG